MEGEANIRLLEQAVANHAFVRGIEKHRGPDGQLDTQGNLKLWDEGMAPFEKIYLRPGGAESEALGADGAYLVFVPAKAPCSDIILIAHGGGFRWRTGCEGPNVALFFHRLGYHTAILTYRLSPAHDRRESMEDMRRAIRILRDRQRRWGTDGRVIAMGFSAGAMLCGNCATHFDLGAPDSQDPVERCSSRPDAVVMGYGAMSCVSFPMPFGMEPEESLFGATPQERFYFAPEKHVTPQTPPMFLWQTLSDDGRHGLCLAKALQDAGVAYELHIMEGGVHGLGLADGENDLGACVPHIAHWAQLCHEWLKLRKGET